MKKFKSDDHKSQKGRYLFPEKIDVTIALSPVTLPNTGRSPQTMTSFSCERCLKTNNHNKQINPINSLTYAIPVKTSVLWYEKLNFIIIPFNRMQHL